MARFGKEGAGLLLTRGLACLGKTVEVLRNVLKGAVWKVVLPVRGSYRQGAERGAERGLNGVSPGNSTYLTTTSRAGPKCSPFGSVIGTIFLRNLETSKSVSLTAWDGAGCALGDSQQGEQTEDGWELSSGDPATTWYVVTVER